MGERLYAIHRSMDSGIMPAAHRYLRQFMKKLLLISVSLIFPYSAESHHSSAAFNTQETIEVTGTISEYSFRNPHVYMTLLVSSPDGTVRNVEVEAGAGSVIAPLGFTRDAVSEGDVVTIVGNPGRRNPDELLLGRELYHQDGTYFPLNISSRSIDDFGDDVAQSIAGTWFPPRTSFFAFLGGSGSWPLTAAGTSARANTSPLDTTHKDCIPIGTPGLMFYPVANTIAVSEDQVVMTIDWLDAVRTIYLDGRAHPESAQTFLQGHSTGHWEGEALLVETTNFSEHAMGLAMNLPGSEQKHMLEKFALSEDGKQMIYSGKLSDPVYLAEPIEWSGTWVYRPTMEHSNESCDLDAARRFLDD